MEKDPELAKIIVGRHSPSSDVQSIEQWEDYLRQHSGTTYHPVGTCSMMPEEMGGVVDPQLRVYGTENVRGKSALLTRMQLSRLTMSEPRSCRCKRDAIDAFGPHPERMLHNRIQG